MRETREPMVPNTAGEELLQGLCPEEMQEERAARIKEENDKKRNRSPIAKLSPEQIHAINRKRLAFEGSSVRLSKKRFYDKVYGPTAGLLKHSDYCGNLLPKYKSYTPAMLEALRLGLNQDQINQVKIGGFIVLDRFNNVPQGVTNCYQFLKEKEAKKGNENIQVVMEYIRVNSDKLENLGGGSYKRLDHEKISNTAEERRLNRLPVAEKLKTLEGLFHE